MHVGHWTLYAKPVVIRKDGVAHALNVKFYDYVGGNETTLWDFSDPDHIREYSQDNIYYRSMFAIPVKVNKPVDQLTVFDVTGAFNKYLGATPSYCQDRMFPVYAHAWGWKKDLSNPLNRPIIPHDPDVIKSAVTVVARANMLLYDHKKRDISFRIRGVGHLGDREYDSCADVRRGVANYLYPVGPNGASITAIVF